MRTSLVVVLLVACSSPAAQSPVTVATTTPVAAPAKPPAAVDDRGLEPAMPTLRLPRNFLPTGYTARLAIDPAQSGFDGTIAITGTVVQRSSVIWLHGHNLSVARAVATGGSAPVALAVTSRGSDLLEIRAQTPLAAGAWTLTLDYTGHYDEVNTTGAFKQTVAGEPYVYSQFEAVYARWAFPCFDEPDNKVPWKLTLDVPAGLVAVSNTPEVSAKPLDAGHKRVEFAATKPLPSYLVAFGVGPFDVVDGGASRSGIPVRLIAMKGRGPDTAWAKKTTARLLDLVEEFFGSPYPYEKLDMLAIPITVGFGAMENAGLITFTETLMLLDPTHAARQREYAWTFIAAHEIAHQWFGDLVTMKWWDDIWLNEGFANWVERKISAKFEPTWHEELAEITERSSALRSDSIISARQIRQPIVVPGDIDNAFDGITYDKGASILNMFEGYVGPEIFVKGIRNYLKQHEWGNATSTDFAAAISEAAGKDLGPAFATFLDQAGAPEITATLSCDGGSPRVALSQRRYVPPGSPPAPAGKPWIVPVCIAYDRSGKRAETCTLLEDTTGSVALEASSCPRWIMPNADGRGYYRNAYTAAQVVQLRDDAWPQLKSTERQVVVFDASNLAGLGKLPVQLALSFLPKLLAAGDRFSVDAALQIPRYVRNLIPADLRPSYEAWLRRTFGPAARKAGLAPTERDSLDVEAARGDLIDVAGSVGRDPALIAEAVKLAARWRDLPPAIRGHVIALAAHANPAIFDRLLKDVRSETDRVRRGEMIRALATARDVKQQRAALALILDPALDIRDTQFMLFGAEDEANQATARQFFREHKDEILKRIPTDGTTGGQSWLAYVFTAGCLPDGRDENVEYITATFARIQGAERVVHQAIEGLDQCIARRKLIEPELRAWLDAGRGAPGGVGRASK